MLKTACHCGAVTIELARKPRSITECNCSICRRYGARWAYYLKKSIKITAPASGLQSYKRGKVLYFDRCRRCGCVMLWRLIKSNAPNDRMGVNLRHLENPDVLDNIKIMRFDGAKTWSDVGTVELKEPWW